MNLINDIEKRIEEVADNDRDFKIELVNLFIEDGQSLVDAIGGLVESQSLKDDPSWRRDLIHSTHTLKGASANMGANDLRAKADLLELAVIQGNFTNLGDLFTDLLLCHRQTTLFLEAYRNRLEVEMGQAGNAE